MSDFAFLYKSIEDLNILMERPLYHDFLPCDKEELAYGSIAGKQKQIINEITQNIENIAGVDQKSEDALLEILKYYLSLLNSGNDYTNQIINWEQLALYVTDKLLDIHTCNILVIQLEQLILDLFPPSICFVSNIEEKLLCLIGNGCPFYLILLIRKLIANKAFDINSVLEQSCIEWLMEYGNIHGLLLFNYCIKYINDSCNAMLVVQCYINNFNLFFLSILDNQEEEENECKREYAFALIEGIIEFLKTGNKEIFLKIYTNLESKLVALIEMIDDESFSIIAFILYHIYSNTSQEVQLCKLLMRNVSLSTGPIYVKIILDCIEMLLNDKENSAKAMQIFALKEFRQLMISYHETYDDVAKLGVMALFNNSRFTNDAEFISKLFDLILDKKTDGNYVKMVIELQERDDLRDFWVDSDV